MLRAPPARSAVNVPLTRVPVRLHRTSDAPRSATRPRWTKSPGRRRPPPPPSVARRFNSQNSDVHTLPIEIRSRFLQFQALQVLAKIAAKLCVLQGDLHRCFQKSQFIARIVGDAIVNVRPQTVLLGQDAQ